MQVFNDYIILARDVSTDSRDKMLSIFKIIDKFSFSLDAENYKEFVESTKDGIVEMPSSYFTASSWSLDEAPKKEFRARLESRIIDPLGKELGKSKNDIVFPAGHDRIRLNGKIEGVAVNSNGNYTLEMSVIDPVTEGILGTGSTRYQVLVEELKE
jgi:hypothetical protein